MTSVNEIETCSENFIKYVTTCSVDQQAKHTCQKELGLRTLKLKDIWTTLCLSWLRRLPYFKPVQEKLHREEVGKLGFCPVNSKTEDQTLLQTTQGYDRVGLKAWSLIKHWTVKTICANLRTLTPWRNPSEWNMMCLRELPGKYLNGKNLLLSWVLNFLTKR